MVFMLFIASQFPFDFIAPHIMTEQIGKGYQGIRAIQAFEHLSMNKQEVTLNVVITTEKNEKQYVRPQ